MKRGSLIVYDLNGEIWFNSGDADGDVPSHVPPKGLPYIITEYGEYSGNYPIRVDVTKTPHQLVLKPIEKTNEQLRIEELENQLLLNENSNVEGGIF